MEATIPGTNRTGAAVSPVGTQAMNAAADELSPSLPIDTTAMEAERMVYINDAESVGSIPPPLSVKGVLKTGMAKLKGSNPSIFMDKLGERIAFETLPIRWRASCTPRSRWSSRSTSPTTARCSIQWKPRSRNC